VTEEDIPRLTASEKCVLELLMKQKKERFGAQLVDESGGVLSRNSIYIVLDRMQEKGFVESRPEEKDPSRPGLPRRLYKVTGTGAYAFKLNREWATFVANRRRAHA
jgi:DNA-binding PadR family transcriptional regulator